MRRENEVFRRENRDFRDGLRRVEEEFGMEWKEGRRKVEVRDVGGGGDDYQHTTAVEMRRLNAEKERERIFNDAVKQLRALTAVRPSFLLFFSHSKFDLLFCSWRNCPIRIRLLRRLVNEIIQIQI